MFSPKSHADEGAFDESKVEQHYRDMFSDLKLDKEEVNRLTSPMQIIYFVGFNALNYLGDNPIFSLFLPLTCPCCHF